ncbi:TonB-dependent receptor domain-containing protein [Granulicella cerasi]|uniref:TonB-dependent receptor domain-containing protein n=1 Tax=Granulicella cerasi TaxID=741063 RepID=A0ABW1Z7J4_9BACT|nr:TonB-dependent receptor [Granulicella cerasi]
MTQLFSALKRRKLSAIASVAFLGLGCCAAVAQTAVDGAVGGTVVDASGAAIPNAKIVVHSTATNAESTVKADAAGYFRAPRLIPGDYTVSVSSDGFASYIAQHVIVQVGKLTEVTPKLTLGASQTTVQVSGDVPLINTESSDYTTDFNPTALSSLPINGRHWTSFALLSPGVTLGNSAFGLVSFRGASNLQNNFLVDGVDDNDAFQSVERGYTRVGYSTAEDAILEFQVLTSNFSAQYGRALGGGVNAVTRSGGNTFHGDAFEYYRDNDFGATNPFNILQTIPTYQWVKPKDKRHQYGGSFSGPIIKDKLFFLFAFDQQKRNFPIVAVPTPQFTAYSNAAYNNCSNGAGGTVDAVTCALNRGVTAAQITAAENFITAQSGIAPRQGNQIINFLKLDYKINDKNQASISYDRMRWDSPNGIQTNPVVRRGITSLGNDYDKVDSIIGKVTTMITPKLSNEIRIGYGREYDSENQTPALSIEPVGNGGLPPGASISSNSGFVMGTPSYIPRTNYPDERVIEATDNVSWSKGQHTLTMGVNFHYVQDNIIDVDYKYGVFNYTRAADFFTDYAYYMGNTAATCNNQFTSGAGTGLPCYTTMQQAFGRAQFVYHTNEYAAYVQDDWKILPRLTLNLGVRYDFEQLPNPKIPSAAAQTAYKPSDKDNFAPRIGFAWDVFGTNKTLVHGGYGIYYGRIQNGNIFRMLSATGSSGAQFQLSTSQANGATVRYPNIVSTAVAPVASNVAAFAPNFQVPYSTEAELALQQDLGYKTVLGIAYLGSFGRKLPTLIDTNINRNVSTLSSISFTGGPLAGNTWSIPVYTARSLTNAANGVPYVAYSQLFSAANSSYNALAVTVEHRMAQGVQLSASYTFSKAMDYLYNQTAIPTETNDPTDPNTLAYDKGRSVNDIPQRFTGNITFQPTFKIENKIASQVANGWTLAPVWTVQSGVRYSMGLSGGTAVTGASASSFNGTGGVNVVNFRAYRNLGNNASLPGVERDQFKYANIDEVDLRLSRGITFMEKYKLTLAAEVFNILNRQQFSGYNTTAYTLSGSAAAGYTAAYQSTFGTPSQSGNTIYRERQLQLFGRFEF